MRLRNKLLTVAFLIAVFLIMPIFGTGAIWIQHVGLLPDTAVVFSSDAAAIDRFMASALKGYYGDRIGICDGANDEVEIQAAFDAVRSVKLSTGQFNCEIALNISNSDQTLRGCGRNTILTTSTSDLVFLSAIGGAGTEKTGIIIADLQIDGGAGEVSDCGIYFEYVDYSFIHNVYSRRHASGTGAYMSGIYLLNSDFNIITDNTCQGNGDAGVGAGIYLYSSSNNTVNNNMCQGNNSDEIHLYSSSGNTVVGNTCQGSVYGGIYLYAASHNTVSSNTIRGNARAGIHIYNSSNDNTITDNTLTENSQETTNTYDDIYLENSDYNNIQGNTCRAGALANKPRYGINISSAACDGNLVIDNDLYDDGFGTAPFNDAGTATRLNTYVVPFSDGTKPWDWGYLLEIGGDIARTWLRLPDKVVQVVRIKVYAVAQCSEADHMRAEFAIYGGADGQGFNIHNGSIANHPSVTDNMWSGMVIHWTITTAGVLVLTGGDSIQIKVLHEVAGNGDCETDATFRTVEIEYV